MTIVEKMVEIIEDILSKQREGYLIYSKPYPEQIIARIRAQGYGREMSTGIQTMQRGIIYADMSYKFELIDKENIC